MHYTMQTRRICGERTGNNDPFLGLEEALHEDTHTSAATSEPALLTDASRGRSQAAPPPRFAMPTAQVGILPGE